MRLFSIEAILIEQESSERSLILDEPEDYILQIGE